MEYKYTSIILDKKDVGETDRIYSFYTLEGGKIQSLAKGVRKSGAKLAGSLENFLFAGVIVMRSRGMGKIVGSVVENNFSALRGNFHALSRVSFAMKTFDKLTNLDYRDESVFYLLKQYLEIIDSQSLFFSTRKNEEYENKIELLTFIFLFQVLSYLGHGCEVVCCSECGKEDFGQRFYFNAKSGGVVCENCAREQKMNFELSVNTVKLLRLINRENLYFFTKIGVDKKEIDFLKLIVIEMIRWV